MSRVTEHGDPTVMGLLSCRLCDSVKLRSVLDLGAVPPSGSYLTPGELDFPESRFPLHLRLCEDCLLLQTPGLGRPGDADIAQPYFASFSDSRVEHARTFVRDTVKRLGLTAESFVVEVGSNDGYLLRHVGAAKIPCLGIEASLNVGIIARERGVPTVTALLDETLAREVRADRGPANLVVANNVYPRVADLRGFTRSLRALVADDGWVSIEVRHALRLVHDAQFESVDHDNVQYYSLFSATRALATAGLAVVDAEILPTHVGAMRIWARPTRIAAPPSSRVVEVLRTEKAAGLHRVEGYLGLRSRSESLRQNLLRFLLQCRADGELVVGYGFFGVGDTLLNYCGIRGDLVEYIVDRDPYRHGCFTAGTRIPIFDPRRIDQDRPVAVLALSSELVPEMASQLGHVEAWGGRLLCPRTLPHLAAST